MNWIDNFMKQVFGFDRVGEITEPSEVDAYLAEAAKRCDDGKRFNNTLPGHYRMVNGENQWCFYTKEYTPGCKIIAYIDGDTGVIETTYYKVITDDENINHLQLSIGVKWDSDDSKEMYSHCTLAAATCIIEVPDDYKAHLDDMKERRERLARQYNVPFKSLRQDG